MKKSLALIPVERIQNHILLLRGQKVMLGQHLAELYGIPVKVLNQAVKRNRDRFPDDFMFQIDNVELDNLKSQIVTSSWGGARRALPYAFTEQGVAMIPPSASSWLRPRHPPNPKSASTSKKTAFHTASRGARLAHASHEDCRLHTHPAPLPADSRCIAAMQTESKHSQRSTNLPSDL